MRRSSIRRNFLKIASGALAAPLVLPTLSRSANDTSSKLHHAASGGDIQRWGDLIQIAAHPQCQNPIL